MQPALGGRKSNRDATGPRAWSKRRTSPNETYRPVLVLSQIQGTFFAVEARTVTPRSAGPVAESILRAYTGEPPNRNFRKDSEDFLSKPLRPSPSLFMRRAGEPRSQNFCLQSVGDCAIEPLRRAGILLPTRGQERDLPSFRSGSALF